MRPQNGLYVRLCQDSRTFSRQLGPKLLPPLPLIPVPGPPTTGVLARHAGNGRSVEAGGRFAQPIDQLTYARGVFNHLPSQGERPTCIQGLIRGASL